jgi:hypothetical protein
LWDMTEAEIQEQVVKLLGIALPSGSLLHHSPNEGMHKPHYRAKQARMGMLSGWPDIEIFVQPTWFRPGIRWSPIFIEMKSAKGRISDKQKDVLATLDRVGCHTMVCRSVHEVIEFLNSLIELKC